MSRRRHQVCTACSCNALNGCVINAQGRIKGFSRVSCCSCVVAFLATSDPVPFSGHNRLELLYETAVVRYANLSGPVILGSGCP